MPSKACVPARLQVEAGVSLVHSAQDALVKINGLR